MIKEDVNKDILNLLEKGDFILGEKVFELESKLAKYVGVKECITCASGTDALLIPLMANDIGVGDAVFTTNFSFFATTEVISLVGATPVFVDIDKDTYNIDPSLLEKQIIKTIEDGNFLPKAIIAVNLFGQICEYNKIRKIAKKYGLILIEDAAQSFGASYNNQKSCSFGDVAATSFYPAKPLGCYGDGGAIFTNNQKLAEICRSIRVHGQGIDKYDNVRIGLNSRLDTFQAIILLHKLKIFDKELELRNNIAQYYNNHLDEYVKIPYVRTNHLSAWAQYSIQVLSNRSEIIKILNDANIPTAVFYDKPFHTLDIYKNVSFGEYKVSDDVSNTILSIPMHPYLSKDNQDIIISTIKNFYQKK